MMEVDALCVLWCEHLGEAVLMTAVCVLAAWLLAVGTFGLVNAIGPESDELEDEQDTPKRRHIVGARGCLVR